MNELAGISMPTASVPFCINRVEKTALRTHLGLEHWLWTSGACALGGLDCQLQRLCRRRCLDGAVLVGPLA